MTNENTALDVQAVARVTRTHPVTASVAGTAKVIGAPMIGSMYKTLTLAAVGLFVLAGCAGHAGDPVAGVRQSETLDVSDVNPLPSVPRDIWADAPAGCEGQLTADTDFGVATGEPELVVAMDGAFTICIDTYPAVEAELGVIGEDHGIDRLWLGYLSALQELEPFQHMAEDRAPTPAPRAQIIEQDLRVLGDPNPQPNRPGTAAIPEGVDPTPQPNSEDPAGSEASEAP